jgi:hypothetical protein
LKILAAALLLVALTVFGCAELAAAPIKDIAPVTSPCLDQDVWVYIRHIDDTLEWHQPCIVIVKIPKHSLQGDFNNCPAQDVKLVGQGRTGFGMSIYSGYHVIVLKKGYLNKPENYTTRPPKPIKIPANNINSWHVSK